MVTVSTTTTTSAVDAVVTTVVTDQTVVMVIRTDTTTVVFRKLILLQTLRMTVKVKTDSKPGSGIVVASEGIITITEVKMRTTEVHLFL